MNDTEIIRLYNARDEMAIEESIRQYKKYCYAIAFRILQNSEDADECVIDTWMKAWNRIPPDHPDNLATYLGAITRTLSINRYKGAHRQKRGGKTAALVFSELDTMLIDTASPDQICEQNELARIINHFLDSLPERERNIFLCRYYFFYPVKDIAKSHGIPAAHVYVTLSRTLEKLKKYLVKENYV